jgi:hypothetical protein
MRAYGDDPFHAVHLEHLYILQGLHLVKHLVPARLAGSPAKASSFPSMAKLIPRCERILVGVPLSGRSSNAHPTQNRYQASHPEKGGHDRHLIGRFELFVQISLSSGSIARGAIVFDVVKHRFSPPGRCFLHEGTCACQR